MFFVGTQIALPACAGGQGARARGDRREALEGHARRADDAGGRASRTSTSSTGSACGCRRARRRRSSTRLQAEMVKALAEPDVRQQFDTLGLRGVGMKPGGVREVRRQGVGDARSTIARRIGAREEMSEHHGPGALAMARSALARHRRSRARRPDAAARAVEGRRALRGRAVVRLRPRDQRAARRRRVDRQAVAGPVRQPPGRAAHPRDPRAARRARRASTCPP